jgi:Flp pilus assembly protein TadD
LLDYWPLRRMRLPFGLDSAAEPPPVIHAPRTASIAMLFVEKLPLLALSAGVSIATHAMQTVALRYGDPIGLGDRVTNAVVSYGWYVMKMLWPSGLGVFYSHPNMAGGTPWTAVQVTAAASLLLAAAACVVFARRRRALTVGILWFVGTLVPVIGLVQVGMQAFADRYTYLPLIGLFIAVSWEGKALVDWLSLRRRGVRMAAVLVCAAVLAALAVTARTQVATWRDSRTLFTRSLAVWPGNATMHYSLGRELWAAADAAGAIANYREAVRIMPTFGAAYLNLGSSLYLTGHPADALEPLDAAVRLRPRTANAHFYLAASHSALGNYDKAIEGYRVAISIDPGRAVFRQGIAQALMGAGRYAEARAESAEAQRLGAQRPAAEP